MAMNSMRTRFPDGFCVLLVLVMSIDFGQPQKQEPIACIDLSWPHEVDRNLYLDGGTKNGWRLEDVFSNCKETCPRNYKTTYFGIRKNTGFIARCFCHDKFNVTAKTCEDVCDGYQCGGSNRQAVSLYTTCEIGKYEPDCSKFCYCANNDVCPILTGVCPGDCQKEWYGTQCDMECGNCIDDKCDKDNGNCGRECQDGYHGSKCDMDCGQCADDKCDKNTAKCSGECKDNYYGPKCTLECPPGCDTKCAKETGDCTSGCDDGFYGSRCEANCTDKCVNSRCTQVDGICLEGCVDGWYRDKCDLKCGHCANIMCDQTTGECPSTCQDNFYGSMCNQPCPEQCNTNCAQTDGSCSNGCEPGYHGDLCQFNCSKGCLGSTCNQTNAACDGGCREGYFGPPCEMCSLNCHLKKCKADSGYCTEGCEDGHYGPNCQKSCPENCNSTDCERDSGKCVSGCIQGYHDDQCDSPCSENCKDKICDQQGGGCTNGHLGTTTKSQTGVIAGSVVAVLVLVGVVIAAVFVILRRRRKRPGGPEDNENQNIIDNIGKSSSSSHIADVGEREPSNPDQADRTFTVQRFLDHFRSATNLKALEAEYKSLTSETLYDSDEARGEGTKNKNRFKGIYPYNYNRVKLQPIEGEARSDYINASRVQGYATDDLFIASLGPREFTLDDFWRMIWQEKVSLIVMVTNLVETGNEKCFQYWPEDNSVQFGEITVAIKEERTWPSMVFRKLVAQKGPDKRVVSHYHFTVWPDHSVPEDATALLNFRRKFFKVTKPNVPTVIHCSAGVGRTGTLIALDYLIKQADTEDKLNVFDCVERLRHQRKNMVQTSTQYRFLHQALCEYLRVRDTAISQADFIEEYHQLIGEYPRGNLLKQYEILQELVPELKSYDLENALSEDNKSKNRFHDIIPSTYNRVYLTSRVRGRNDYINAVRVNGFRSTDAFHVTQFPLKDTVIDFWRMIQDKDSNAIVVLAKASQAKDTSEFLPAKNRPMELNVNWAFTKSSKTTNSCRVIDICEGEKVEGAEYMNNEDIANMLLNEQKLIRVFEMTLAEDQELLDPKSVIDVTRQLRQWGEETGDKTVTVTCLNGALYSGQFVACCNMFEMIESEQEVDVYQVTKYIRDSRPQFVNTLTQYKHLHDILKFYLADFELYANV